MWPDRVSNLVPLALESDALLTALRGPARRSRLYRLIPFGIKLVRSPGSSVG